MAERTAEGLGREWAEDPRWAGIRRTYSAKDVLRLGGTLRVEHTLARSGAERLFRMLHGEGYVPALGALTGHQAVEMVRAGLRAIYISGWQVAGDANGALETYPDQSLYPADSVPNLVRRVNNALRRADQIAHLEGRDGTAWYAPVVADGEAGFGGMLNVFELMRAMIEAGAAGVHFEDQVSSLKKCGHMGGKVLAPVREAVLKLNAARLAADVLGVPTVLIARTDAEGARLKMGGRDPIDDRFVTGRRTPEGFHEIRGGIELAVERARAYAPFADVVWCETSRPDLGEAEEFAAGVHEKFPGKPLAYNCSPSFNWEKHLDGGALRTFQEKLAGMGYRFQFVTLAGFHALNASMFELARGYGERGMAAYAELQRRELELERSGYEAARHQAFVGAGYFDEIQLALTGGEASTTALKGSTEEAQF
ncbi:MAG: isocitrate lyase [Deltaproteobacteria bacterium]|nr:isocitrate lyase [Deltaproteobacteria bacterium]